MTRALLAAQRAETDVRFCQENPEQTGSVSSTRPTRLSRSRSALRAASMQRPALGIVREMPEGNDDAERFLSTIAPDAQLTFQTFREKGVKSGAHVFHGSFQKHAAKLAELNRDGHGVFVMPNRGDLRGRKAGNVVAVRALFVDLDGAPLDPVMAGPLPPHVVVETSPGRWHCYWRATAIPLECFTRAQRALAARFSGDRSVSDLPRVMRVPGFWHSKRDPYLSRLERCATDAPYSWTVLRAAFGLDEAERASAYVMPDRIPEGARNTTLFGIARKLRSQGHGGGELLRRLARINCERCQPPLPDAEVVAIATSVESQEVSGNLPLPLADLVGGWTHLDVFAKATYVEARLAAASNGRVFLTPALFKRAGVGRTKRTDVRRQLVESGLLEVVERAVYGVRGGPRLAAVYRFRRLHRRAA